MHRANCQESQSFLERQEQAQGATRTFLFGLNKAADRQTIEHLGLQYVDQRRSFAKLVTAVKQTALHHMQRVSNATT